MANIKYVDSVVDREFRNRINQLIDVVNSIGTSFNDLVVKGVMTTEQYSQLLTAINGLVKIGEVDINSLSTDLKMEIEQINKKIDKDNLSVFDINKNLGKIDQTFLSDELLKQIAGTANINATVSDGSITTQKVADKAVTAEKTDFISVSTNLLNLEGFKEGFFLSDTNVEQVSGTFGYTDYIPVSPSTVYSTAGVSRWLLYDGSKNYINGQSNTSPDFTTSDSAYFARFNVRLSDKPIAQLNKGALVEYESYSRALNIPVEKLSVGAVETQNIKDRNVSKEKLSFVDFTKNLVDESTLLRGYAVTEGSKGAPNANASNSVAQFVPVKPITDYTISTGASHRIFSFDKDKNFIKEQFFGTEVSTFKTSSNTAYISFNVHDTFLGKAQLNEGATLGSYVKYKADKLSGVYGEGAQDVFKKSANLFDETLLTLGAALNDTGVPVENVSNNVTHFIPVESDTFYEVEVAQSNKIAFYDANKNYLSMVTGVSDNPFVFKTPSNAKYMRVNVHRGYVPSAYITKGVLNRRIRPAGHYLRNAVLPKRARSVNEYYKAPTMPSMTVNDSTYLKNIGTLDYYAMYDALMAEYPQYIKKTFLGNDGDGVPINKYEFKPVDVPEVKNEYPRIFINTGTHGSEKMPIWTVYKFFELLCKEWQTHSILEELRFQVHFVVIPIVCPYGVENHTRKNKNGVDLVRNYPGAWEAGTTDPNASTYRGSNALSELEAVHVYRTYKSYNHWDYVVDFHNFSTNPDENKNFWVAGTDSLTRDAGQIFLRKITAELSKEHDFVDADTALGWTDINIAGIYWTAHTDGFYGSLFETRETLAITGGQMYDSLAMTWSVEAWVNWIYLMYRNSIQ